MSALFVRPPISPGYCASIFRDPDGHSWLVAQVANGVDNERLANVFAVSEELLEALKEVLAMAPAKAPGAGLIEGIEVRRAAAIAAARAAIAKAEGK
jgi:hypothetical protein